MKSKIERNKRCLLLAYDHGLEHGPRDFNERNVNPEEILRIAEEGPFTGIILQKGVVEKYCSSFDVPLILKVNGKSSLNPRKYSALNCSFERAMELGADAVGFTIYPGSIYESKMQEEFRKIQEKATQNDIPTILWSYPRGKGVKNEKSLDTIAYAARISLELGADYTKVKYPSKGDFSWVVKNAGKTKVLCSGGGFESEEKFLEKIKNVIGSGASGLAVGRNIWKRDNPLEISKRISNIIFG